MRLIETGLPGCVVVEPRVFEDARGFFYESFNHAKLKVHGIQPIFVQGNVSVSRGNVLRGLHYQCPNPQGKFISVLEGEIWDVAVDIRRGSPTFSRWTAVVLGHVNKRQLWVPEGFAHGFVVLSDKAIVSYLCTETYDPNADAAIRWDDPQLAIDWPVSVPVLSDKDAKAPLLGEVPAERLPRFDG